MKVAFINPPVYPFRKIMRNFDCATESKGNYLYQPYDFLLMSGMVPENWPLLFLDCIAQKISAERALKKLEEYDPKVIVCALASSNWEQDRLFVGQLRKRFPLSTLLVFGDVFIEDSPARSIDTLVDGIFTSPVTFNFRDLEDVDVRKNLRRILRPEDAYSRSDLKAPRKVFTGRIRHELFLSTRYRWPFSRKFLYTTIFTAWGCPYSCSYCVMGKFPNYVRPAEEVLEELRAIHQMGIKEIYIGDRSFGLPLSNVNLILDGMISAKFNFSWSTYFHPNQYSPALLEKMKAAGCHTIIIGVESHNQASLKDYGRHVREDQFRELIRHAREIGMEVCGDFIIGLPHDDRETVARTIRYARELDIEYASFNVAAPLPGSSIRKLAVDRGIMKPDEENFDSMGNNKVLSVSALTVEEIVNFRNEAVLKFYLRPGYLLRRLSSIREPEQLIIQLQEAVQIFRKVL